MSIGTGIVLIVIGAILTFALNIDVGWVDLRLVGEILMAAGVIVVIIGIVLIARKRRSTITTRSDGVEGTRVDRIDRTDDID
jgi:hypothetical protein